MSPIDPADRIAALLAGATPVRDQVTATLTPAIQAAPQWRSLLADAGRLFTVPTKPAGRTISAVDGAFTTTPLVAGDLTCALAVRATSHPTTSPLGGLSVEDGLDYSGFHPHTASLDNMPRAMMMLLETALTGTPQDTSVLSIIDGTHTTAYQALATTLPSLDTDNPLVQRAMDVDLPARVAHLASSPNIVACPKSSSATDLWDTLTSLGAAMPAHVIPDKTLATILLNPGEGVFIHGRDRHLPPPSSDGMGGAIAYACWQQLSDSPATIDYQVVLAKPHGANTVFRIEAGSDAGVFQAVENATAVVRSECVPHLAEPLVQHLADTFCKEQVTAATTWATTQASQQLADIAPHLATALTSPYRTA